MAQPPLKLNTHASVIKQCYSLIPYGFVAGGYANYCTAKWAHNQTPNDIDFFFKTKGEYEEMEGLLLASNLPERFRTDNGIKFTPPILDPQHPFYGLPPINLISKVRGSIEGCVRGFDLSVSQVSIGRDMKIGCTEEYRKTLSTFHITLNNNPTNYGLNTFHRISKYYLRGYFTPVEEIEKLLAWIRGIGEEELGKMIKERSGMEISFD